jgi:hypothetical protein
MPPEWPEPTISTSCCLIAIRINLSPRDLWAASKDRGLY